MKNTKTILAVLGVGALLSIAARPALAEVGVSFDLSHGSIGAQVVIGDRSPVVISAGIPLQAAQQRVIVAPSPTVVTTPTAVNLANNYAYGPFSGYAGQARYFQIYVPAGQTYLTIVTEGGAGESDLLAAPGYWPTSDNTDLVSYNDGTSERIEVLYPAAGWWNVVVYGRGAFANVSVLASYWQQETYLPTYTTYDPYPTQRTNVLVHIAGRDRLRTTLRRMDPVHPAPSDPAAGCRPAQLRQAADRRGAAR